MAKEYDGLKPQNLVQAAQADIARRKINAELAAKRKEHPSVLFPPYEPYALMKEHVRAGDGVFGVLALALERAERIKRQEVDPPKKRLSKIIYGDPSLIRDALNLERRKQ